jgi:signal transduction histidine kinase
MAQRQRFAPQGRVRTFTALAVLLAIAFSVMAWRTVSTERQRVAFRTCGFAGDASHMLQVKSRLYLEAIAEPIFAAVGGRAPLAPTEPLATPAALAAADRAVATCHCAPHVTSSAYFRLDIDPDGTPGRLMVEAAAESPQRDDDRRGVPLQPLTVDTTRLREAVGRLMPGVRWEGVVAAGVAASAADQDSLRAIAVLSPKYLRNGQLRAVYGLLIAPTAFAREVIAPVFDRQPVFPTMLAVRPATPAARSPNKDLANLAIFDSHWTKLYQNGVMPDTPVVSMAKGCVAMAITDPALGLLMVHVGPNPAVFQRWIHESLAEGYWPFLTFIAAAMLASMIAAILGARREAELARLRSDFVSNISHELRMPLAQILMSGETLRLGRTRSPAQQGGEVDSIVREARRLTGLVENALSFSGIEHHTIQLNPRPVPLHELIADTIAGMRTLADGAQATIRGAVADDVVALIDPNRFRQVLYNLIDNAIKYGPPAQEILVGANESTVAPGWIRVWVDDTGPGVPSGEQSAIFEPFVRLERDCRNGIAGSGLGLAVVRDLVNQHGGRIWAEGGHRGVGSRFVVEIPSGSRT